MERFVDERRAERDALLRVVGRERHRATHAGGGAHRVPRARDREHRRDVLDSVARSRDGRGERAVERELRGRHHARAELVLQAIHEDAVRRPVFVSHFDVKEREAAAAGRIAFGARERERHLRSRRGREPFRSEQTKLVGAVALRARDGLRDRDVGAARALRHPLPARPRLLGIARGESRNRALDERRVARRE